MSASSLLLKAYVTAGLKLNGEDQHLIGLLNRISLLGPLTIIDTADAVIIRIIEISLSSLHLSKLTWPLPSENRDFDSGFRHSLAPDCPACFSSHFGPGPRI